MNTESQIPLTGLYADEAPGGSIESPTSAQFHSGVAAEMTLPAAWWNFFANLFTNTNIKAKEDILAILAELNNVLVAGGITPDPAATNQLITLLQKGPTSTVNADKVDNCHAGNAEGNIPINNNALNVGLIASSATACSGNAASATKLQTARKIGGVSFNGTADINLPGVNAQGNQNTTGTAAACSGNAASATKLKTARKIGGVDFDGTAPINLPGVNVAGNQNTTGKASTAGDADLLDGLDSLRFAEANSLIITGDVLATMTKSGMYVSSADSTNAPSTGTYCYFTNYFDNNTSASIAVSKSSGSTFINRKVNGLWTGWKKIWNEENQGADSDLDADLLDGQHGSYYAPKVDFVNGEAGTYAAKSLEADESWVIPKGLYMFTVNASTGAGATQSISLQINSSGTWSGTIIPVGLILSDGINYRLKNHATSVQGAIYRKLA